MSSKLKDWCIILFFIFFTLFLFRPYVTQRLVPFPGNLLVSYYQPWASYQWDGYAVGPPAKPIGFDTLRMFYPLRKIVTDQIKSGQPPLWNPYSFSGNVLLAAYQSAVFHPLSFLFFIFAQIDAWSIIIFLSPILTAAGMYVFLKDLRLSRKTSFFGALTYAFSGMMIVWWEEMFMSVYSLIPLPYVLLAINQLFRNIHPKSFILLTLSLVFSILSGYFQTTFYLLVMASFFTLFKLFDEGKNKLNALLIILFSGIVSLLICGIQLIPALEAYRLSARSLTDVKAMFTMFFAPTNHLITLLAPDFFGNPATHNYFANSFYHEKVIWIGIPALIFVLVTAITMFEKKAKGMVRFFTLSGIFFLTLVFSLPTSWFLLYHLHLPFVSEMTPTRISYLSSFCFAVAGAFGVERYLTRKERWSYIILIAIIAVIFWKVWPYANNLFPKEDVHHPVPMRNLVVPAALFFLTSVAIVLGLIKTKLKMYVYFFLIALTLFGITYFANKYMFFSKRDYTYPAVPVINKLKEIAGINRFWSVGEAHIERNFSNFFGLQSPEGYESFNIRRYSELVYASHNRSSSQQIPERADAFLYYAKDMSGLSQNTYPLRLMRLLGVKYVVAFHEDTIDPSVTQAGFTRIWTDNTFDIFEFSQALPRFFLVNNFTVAANDNDILDTIYDPNYDVLRTIVVEKTPLGFTPHTKEVGSVELVRYSPNTVMFKTQTDNGALLFLSDNDYPGWEASIDGNPTQIYRANYAFRSVVIPKGDHNIVFTYKPQSFTTGVWFSAAGLALFILTGFIMRKQTN